MKYTKNVIGEPSLLLEIEKDAPKLWKTLKSAQEEGLLFIDEKTDSITATNRLLLTYPDLHETLNQIIDHWSLKKNNIEFSQLDLLIRESWRQ